MWVRNARVPLFLTIRDPKAHVHAGLRNASLRHVQPNQGPTCDMGLLLLHLRYQLASRSSALLLPSSYRCT
jgi:hypothetical protein